MITAVEAVEMVLAGGNDLLSEITNVAASYIDICEEIEECGEEPGFDEHEYRIELRRVAEE